MEKLFTLRNQRDVKDLKINFTKTTTSIIAIAIFTNNILSKMIAIKENKIFIYNPQSCI